MDKEKICKRLMGLVAFDYMATGSRVICNPPVMDTDEDYIVYDPTEQFCQGLYGMGIDTTNGEYLGPAQFVTFLSKQDRIKLFQKVLYDTPEFEEIPF